MKVKVYRSWLVSGETIWVSAHSILDAKTRIRNHFSKSKWNLTHSVVWEKSVKTEFPVGIFWKTKTPNQTASLPAHAARNDLAYASASKSSNLYISFNNLPF